MIAGNGLDDNKYITTFINLIIFSAQKSINTVSYLL